MQSSPILSGTTGLKARFIEHFASLWRRKGHPQAIGLAVSGGVDSMALAGLCREYVERGPGHPELHAFVVDHQLRNFSRGEALNVKRELLKSNIQTSILTLDWSNYGDPAKLEHLETVARNLRYQAIAKACTERSIRTLLLGHHADDQAETVLSRVVNGYHGSGLRGIKVEALLPVPPDVCPPDYGSDISEPLDKKYSHFSVPIAGDGGIAAVRPLLPFRKQELIEYCTSNRLSWFEDHTNADPTFTMRNALRHLQRQESLPQALQMPRLLQVAEKSANLETALDQQAEDLFKDLSLCLDATIGEVSVEGTLSVLGAPALNAEGYRLRLSLMRRLVMLVTPEANVDLSGIANAVDALHANCDDTASHDICLRSPLFGLLKIQHPLSDDDLGALTQDRSPRALDGHQVAGVHFSHYWDRKLENSCLKIRRANPTQAEMPERSLTLTPLVQRGSYPTEPSQKGLSVPPESPASSKWESRWRLWDHRYWIRVRSNMDTAAGHNKITVCFLTPYLLRDLRRTLELPQRQRLSRLLRQAPGTTRFTLPAIVTEPPSPSVENGANGIVVGALPSIGWCSPDWSLKPRAGSKMTASPTRWTYEIKFKHVNVPGKQHKVIHATAIAESQMMKRQTMKEKRKRQRDDGSDLDYATYAAGGHDDRSDRPGDNG